MIFGRECAAIYFWHERLPTASADQVCPYHLEEAGPCPLSHKFLDECQARIQFNATQLDGMTVCILSNKWSLKSKTWRTISNVLTRGLIHTRPCTNKTSGYLLLTSFIYCDRIERCLGRYRFLSFSPIHCRWPTVVCYYCSKFDPVERYFQFR